MKAISLTIIAASVSAVQVPQALMNLRNHTLLSTDQVVHPLESIAHIATFDEIPIFGGHELREQMLEQSLTSTIESDISSLALSVFDRVTKSVSCNAQFAASSTLNFMMRKESRLTYGSFCEEIPANGALRMSMSADVAATLQ
jgi:hypothetical protein